MHVAVVGGIQRYEAGIARSAEYLGHTVEFHRGRVGGRRAAGLEAMVARSELVIIVTEVNSHGAMYIAKRAATQRGKRTLIVRSCTPSSFSALVAEAVRLVA
jgi:hypothetical protein